MSEGWKGDVTPLIKRISSIATGAGSLLVLAAGSRLAVALPANRKAARIVADLYQPQRWKGRLFLTLAKWAIMCGIAKFRPSYKGAGSAAPEVDWLKESSSMGTVGFLGCNPNHGPRCVLAGIDPNSGEKFIAKLGLDGSAAAVRREAEVLDQLSGRFPGVVRSLSLENSYNNNQPQSLVSTFDWALLRLPHLGNASPRSMADPDVSNLLQKWLGTDEKALGQIPWAAKLIHKVAANEAPPGWQDRIKVRRLRRALIHGDFAVWNLRITPDGLTAIDWEWGEEDAVAGIDLAHGLRQECYMVRGMKPERAVLWMLEQAESPTWSGYLDLCGWAGAYDDWLRLGLLHSHFNALNPSAELLKELDIHLDS